MAIETYKNELAFAKSLDDRDELKSYRQKFLFPQHNGKDVIYFT